MLNFLVSSVEEIVDELTSKGVKFEQYDSEYIHTDEKGISKSDYPVMAWFKDPAGNIFSLIQE